MLLDEISFGGPIVGSERREGDFGAGIRMLSSPCAYNAYCSPWYVGGSRSGSAPACGNSMTCERRAVHEKALRAGAKRKRSGSRGCIMGVGSRLGAGEQPGGVRECSCSHDGFGGDRSSHSDGFGRAALVMEDGGGELMSKVAHAPPRSATMQHIRVPRRSQLAGPVTTRLTAFVGSCLLSSSRPFSSSSAPVDHASCHLPPLTLTPASCSLATA